MGGGNEPQASVDNVGGNGGGGASSSEMADDSGKGHAASY